MKRNGDKIKDTSVMTCKDACSEVLTSVFFKYETPKIVLITSRKIGLLNRFVQVLIVCYIVGYVIYYKKGYQEVDVVQSAVTSKLKGVVYTETDSLKRIWDVADYVVPPQENGAFFVTTNVLVTENQTQAVCNEDPAIEPQEGVICNSDNDCEPNTPVINGNGVRTGVCAPLTSTSTNKTCLIHAWCPVENDTSTPKPALLEASKNFTVLIKNFIHFPKFGEKSRNILGTSNRTYLSKCKYNADTDPFCPIFVLETIVNYAKCDYSTLAVKGGVIEIEIRWDCNLDFNIEECKPVYRFSRLDDENALLAPGWNFRYADHTTDPATGAMYRTLYKAYGIRFVVFVTGMAGKFSPLPLFLNIGSGLALLVIARVLCDLIVLYLLKMRFFFREKKYLPVVVSEEQETFSPLEDDGLIESTRE